MPNNPNIIEPIDRQKNGGYTTYKVEYDQVAYDVLSEGKSKHFLATALHCRKVTLLSWMREHESFKEAVEMGLTAGASHHMEQVGEHMFMPSSMMNMAALKFYMGNVYGIKEDPAPAVVINNTGDGRSAEEKMMERGIPLPEVDCTDDGNIDDIEKDVPEEDGE
ncbi:MAG: hypothetical protein GY861_24185 [bacterium]|nr:hypothetical protein [bacterium]